MNLSLDMSRGKPGASQLDVSRGLLTCLGEDDYRAADGTDCRNYGGLDGLPEMKALFAELFQTAPADVLVGGNSSLQMMYNGMDLLRRTVGPGKTILCPVPGYDRHFAIAERLGFAMQTVPMTPDGPDTDAVRDALRNPDVVGLWCVPVFSNPQGVTYSPETAAALASLPAASPDFRIFWDNAYAVHALSGDNRPKPHHNLLRLATEAGHPDRALMFTSFSKITFPGAGVAAMAASPANLAAMKAALAVQTIGPDKVNQLRHVRYFQNLDGVLTHMAKHAAILQPKFAAIDQKLTRHLAGQSIARWDTPAGGYFIAFETLPGLAERVVTLCAEAGLVMTPAGATFPYEDPTDSHIRIAPSFPPLDQLETAMDLFCTTVKLAASER